MKKAFQNGEIVCTGLFHETAVYNVSNESVSAVFDGKGALTYFAEADQVQHISSGLCNYYVDGVYIDVFSSKTVRMIGRKQEVSIDTEAGTIHSKLFLDQKRNGVFLQYSVTDRKAGSKFEVAYTTHNIQKINVLSNVSVNVIPENKSLYFEIPAKADNVNMFFTFDEKVDFDVSAMLHAAEMELEKEKNEIKLPEHLSEMQKALFYSSYYCALQNYKEKDNYKGFMAGHHYILPMRTYFRDSFYTVLPMYNGHPDKVREQIVTLIKGVSEDGNCPSAVKSDYSAWWGNHYDIPAFLIIMIYDYVRFTGEKAFLSEIIDGGSVMERAEAVIKKLATFEDETGLLYKEGMFNKRDWADEVNRPGYVTYNEILYARAQFCMSKMKDLIGDRQAGIWYMEKFEKTKTAINTELWDERLGYYVNFRCTEYTESNLSVDTVLAAIFGIADDDRAKRMLRNMEMLLECRHNEAVKCEDFGVMSVYPFYRNPQSAYFRSSQPCNYHNGSNWPYWSCMYAYAKRKYGMEYRYALESWFTYNIEKGNYTPIEYFSPICQDGSLLQAWSGVAAFVMDEELSNRFWTD